jgi:hypothetical protein
MKNEHLAEADWKHFRKIAPDCRERYLRRVNVRLLAILSTAETESDTDRFWSIQEEIEKEVKVLRNCLDDHRRSNAVRMAALMFFHKMLDDSDLKGFTDEFSARVRSVADCC